MMIIDHVEDDDDNDDDDNDDDKITKFRYYK